jgi:hypothetical protein
MGIVTGNEGLLNLTGHKQLGLHFLITLIEFTVGKGQLAFRFNMVIDFLTETLTVFFEMLNEGIVDMVHQFLRITHFFHVGKSLDAHSLHSAFKSCMSCMDNDLYLRIDLTELMKEFHALHVRQTQVNNGNIEWFLKANIQGFATGVTTDRIQILNIKTVG